MSLETLVLSDEFQTYLQELRKSVDQPQNLSVMDMIEILFQQIYSIRTKRLETIYTLDMANASMHAALRQHK